MAAGSLSFGPANDDARCRSRVHLSVVHCLHVSGGEAHRPPGHQNPCEAGRGVRAHTTSIRGLRKEPPRTQNIVMVYVPLPEDPSF